MNIHHSIGHIMHDLAHSEFFIVKENDVTFNRYHGDLEDQPFAAIVRNKFNCYHYLFILPYPTLQGHVGLPRAMRQNMYPDPKPKIREQTTRVMAV